ncbi:Starch-binding associating with outer membrane [Tangfeifania diversioriginum]|uniref:Starch-binding associating with outer membrane n=2 Tax=Tangfeifania diversioriginum TaxID=1168035 RepID=A0A1M6K8P6_9BACT|nr:Starch-binding associating with outer membrane [Tangfeifania diversioriginum]
MLFVFIFASCEDFDEMNTNPDLAISVTPDMLATTLILDITRDELATTKGFMRPFMLDKYIVWGEFIDANEQLNGLGRTNFSDYLMITNAKKMVTYAEEMGDPELINSYTALSHFIRAWIFFNLTLEVGDIPYNDAVLAENSGIIKPEYDTQKSVIEGVLNELKEANKLFAQGENFKGDPIYNGDVKKWQRAVNSFRLNVLIQLSNKENDTELNIANRFKQIFQNEPQLNDNSDNFALKYSDATGERYPFSKPNPFSIYPIISSKLIDSLKTLKDYRLFYYASPSPVRIDEGIEATSFDAYVGIDPALSFSDAGEIVGTNDYSMINERYFLSSGEPIALISYTQLNFNIAEAALRGWISGDPETFYNLGIESALNFVATNTPDDELYHHAMKITPAYVENYLSSEPVKLRSSFDDKLSQILTQKYISTFLQIPRSAFYDHRRTGYPVLPFDPATNMNNPSDKFPVRWMYPQVELDYNTDNAKEAIDRQYDGIDDNNGIMWLLK